MYSKKILLISCSSGFGHMRAADALLTYSEKTDPNTKIEHIDLANYTSPLIKFPATTGYSAVVRHWPGLYKLLYNSTNSSKRVDFLTKFSSLIKFNSKKLLNFIKEFKPDRIICTHFLVPFALKEIYKNIPIDIIVTDYYANKIWLSPFIRYYFVANENVKKSLEAENEKTIISGLPIHLDFLKDKDTEKIKNKFKITKEEPVILLMAGGEGLIDTSKIAKKILKEFSNINLIAISGKKNKKIYNKLKKLSFKNNNYQIISFTPDIDELMRIADIIITKPGGMTIAECLFLKKPLIMINPIPGQEEGNVDFVEKNKYGIKVENENDIIIYLNKILNKEIKFSSEKNNSEISNKIILSF